MLAFRAVTKSFGGVTAVKEVSMEMEVGEVLAVIGPNGAGKTTLFNLATGIEKPDSGAIEFMHTDTTEMATDDIVNMGMTRTFQNLQLFNNMNVVENVMVGAHRHGKTGLLQAGLHLPRVSREEAELQALAEEKLRLVGLGSKIYFPAEILPYGEQRLLEIARSMASEPKLILLDEPCAGMNESETQRLAKLIRSLPDKGISVLIVEHDMEMVMSIADRVVVLNYGAKLAEGTPEQVQNDSRVISAYLGEEV